MNLNNRYPPLLLFPLSKQEFIYYYIRASGNLEKYNDISKISDEISTEDIQKILLILNLKYNINVKTKIY